MKTVFNLALSNFSSTEDYSAKSSHRIFVNTFPPGRQAWQKKANTKYMCHVIMCEYAVGGAVKLQCLPFLFSCACHSLIYYSLISSLSPFKTKYTEYRTPKNALVCNHRHDERGNERLTCCPSEALRFHWVSSSS